MDPEIRKNIVYQLLKIDASERCESITERCGGALRLIQLLYYKLFYTYRTLRLVLQCNAHACHDLQHQLEQSDDVKKVGKSWVLSKTKF